MAERKTRKSTIARGEPSPSNAAVAAALRKAYPLVFQTDIAARQIVDAVVREMAEILVREGSLVLREVATIHVVGEEDKANAKRRRLILRTSWSMLDRLNPTYPKIRNRKPKEVTRG